MKIYEAAQLIEAKKLSPHELVEEALKKIEKHDDKIGAYVTICTDAVQKARALGENKSCSPLWGIPIAVKDNICTKGILTTAGSRMLESFVPPYDATVVEALYKNGAVIIGKTNMDEFGMGSSCQHSRIRKTYNPVNTRYVPGGSSGGSAAAVCADMTLGALGSDTGGSIRQPGAFCGIYALKPTYSLVSRYGLIAFASSLDCIGPMCKCTKDIAILLDAIAFYDVKDSTSTDFGTKNYYKSLDSRVKGLRIGVPKEFYENAAEDVRKALLTRIEGFKELGVEVEECSMPSAKYAVSTYYILSSAEASSNLARYDAVRFGKRCEKYTTLEEMYSKSRSEAFGDEVKRRILLGTFVLSEGSYDLYYKKAKDAQSVIRCEFNSLFEKYDALITPVTLTGVPKAEENPGIGKVYGNDMCTSAVSLAGLCAMSVPCGSDKNGMPVGMQLIGKAFGEQTILNLALALEEGGLADGI